MRDPGTRPGTRGWKTAAAAIALAATMGIGAGASARPHGGSCGGKGFGLERLERDIASLGLEQAKLDAAYQAIDQARAQRRSLDGEIRAAHERMRELLEQDAPAVDAVTAQAEKLGALQTEARKAELRALVQVRSLLTPEQWKQIEPRGHRGRFDRGGPSEPASGRPGLEL